MLKGFLREGELRRWAPWIATALVILAFVALQTSMESVCWDEEGARSAKINEAAGCFEFWFNRYQSLIGAVSALAAAGVAWIGIQRQLVKTDEVIVLSARQSSISMLSILDERIESVAKIYMKHDDTIIIEREIYKAVAECIRTADLYKEEFISQRYVSDIISSLRNEVSMYVVLVDKYKNIIDDLQTEWARSKADHIIRRACEDIIGACYISVTRNRHIIRLFEKITKGNNLTTEQLLLCLGDLKSQSSESLFKWSDHASSSVNIIGQAMVDLQNERDNLLEIIRDLGQKSIPRK